MTTLERLNMFRKVAENPDSTEAREAEERVKEEWRKREESRKEARNEAVSQMGEKLCPAIGKKCLTTECVCFEDATYAVSCLQYRKRFTYVY